MKDKRPTLTYLAIFLAMTGFPLAILGHMEYCVLVDGGRECGISFFDRFLQSPPNEIGDTLAGVFGSLAFLAAAVAVIMQSSELAAQREELELTRKELTAQKEASQDMANAMQEQADVFKDEQKQRQEDRAERILEAHLSATCCIFDDCIRNSQFCRWLLTRADKNGRREQQSYDFVYPWPYFRQIKIALEARFSGFEACKKGLVDFEQVYFPGKPDPHALAKSLVTLSDAMKITPDLSQDLQIWLSSLDIPEIQRKLEEVLETPSDFSFAVPNDFEEYHQ